MLTMFEVASVWLGLAVVSTLIANAYFLPEHLLEAPMVEGNTSIRRTKRRKSKVIINYTILHNTVWYSYHVKKLLTFIYV